MTADLDDFYRRMLARLAELKQERIEHAEILAFFAKVLVTQQEAQRDTDIPEIELQQEHLEVKIEEGFNLIERENLRVDKKSAKRLFRKICNLSLEENPALAAASKTLLEADAGDKLDFDGLIAAVIKNDLNKVEKAADDLEVAPPYLQALTKLSIQPSLLAMAVAVSKIAELDNWQHGYCPVCGAPPAMAALVGEEGRRKALCSFCGHIWKLSRLGCPFCDTDTHGDLHYFYGEGEDLYRVQVCQQCNGYLKIIDTRLGGDETAMSLEDVATAHLDLLAEKGGYQRKAPRLLGI